MTARSRKKPVKKAVSKAVPPIAPPDIDAAVEQIRASRMEMARHVKAVGVEAVTHDIINAVSKITTSHIVRTAGNGAHADVLLIDARKILLRLLMDDVDGE